MIATTHPDATAFAARFLANPKDRLGRLVFADWLEERGDDSSVAWADYIRTQAEMETLRWNDPAWDELTERAINSGRRVMAQLRIKVLSDKMLMRLLKLIPPHRCVLELRPSHISPFGRRFLPESMAREHQLIPLHFDMTSGYLACPTPANWEMTAQLTLTQNRNLHVFGTDSAKVSYFLDRAYILVTWAPTEQVSFWALPVYDPTAEVVELEKFLDESIGAGVSMVNVIVTPGEWRNVQVVCFTRTGLRERERMSMFVFRRVVAAVMRWTVDRLPRSGPPAEFTHQNEGQTYLVSALAPAEGLTLWIRPQSAFVDPLR